MITFKSYLTESPAQAIKVWSATGVSPDEIKKRLAQFKEYKAQNLIAHHQERDLNYWLKERNYDSFVAMLERFHKHTTKQETIVKSGAKKIFENDKVLVIVPTTYKASTEYGSSEWCIVYGENYWDDYTTNDGLTPYYILPKNRCLDSYYPEWETPDDAPPLRRIAVMVSSGGNIHSVWDDNDRKITLNTYYKDMDFELETTYYTLDEIFETVLGLKVEEVCDTSYLKPTSSVEDEMEKMINKLFDARQVQVFFETLDRWYKDYPEDTPITKELIKEFILSEGVDINEYFRDVTSNAGKMSMLEKLSDFMGRELIEMEKGILYGLYTYVADNIRSLYMEIKENEPQFEFVQ